MTCLMCILECAGDRDSKAVRAKAVKVLGDLVQIDTGLLGYKPVSACLTLAVEVSFLRASQLSKYLPMLSLREWLQYS